jgi:hypothetical protein
LITEIDGYIVDVNQFEFITRVVGEGEQGVYTIHLKSGAILSIKNKTSPHKEVIALWKGNQETQD